MSIAYDRAPVQMRGVSAPGDIGIEWASYDMKRGIIFLPIQTGYDFSVSENLAFGLATGLEGAYGFAGKLSAPSEDQHYALYSPDGVWRRWNLSWLFSFMTELPPDITVSVGASLGILDLRLRDVFRYSHMNASAVRVAMTYWIK